MPLTSKGEEILANMKKQYGSERGERVFYASKNKGTISGVDRDDADFGSSAGARRMRFGDVRIEEKGDKFVVQGKEYGSYEEAKRAAQAARSDADPPIPADYGSKLDAVERAMVRLGSRMDALATRRADALDPRYLEWQAALKKAYQAKNAADKADRVGDQNRFKLREKAERLEAEQRRLSDRGWQNESTMVIGGRRDADADDTPAERHGVVIGGKREMPR